MMDVEKMINGIPEYFVSKAREIWGWPLIIFLAIAVFLQWLKNK